MPRLPPVTKTTFCSAMALPLLSRFNGEVCAIAR
jgi:hypothetical protein